MMSFVSTLTTKLEQIRREGLYRTRKIIASPQGAEIICDGRKLLNFSSNDYLGLANHPAVVEAFKEAVDVYGVGAGSAHLICGHGAAHHALEENLAELTGRDRALLFSTGYMANVGTVSALVGQQDAVFEDRLNHASLLDGGLLSGARFKRYAHADVDGLERGLRAVTGKALVVTDGVFSMDGDFAPLPALSQTASRYGAGLLVDDAHGLGVIGATGGGIVEHYGLGQNDVPVLIGTLGKALGTFGAFVAGSEALIETLIQQARTYVYTTALPPAVAAATSASLKIMTLESWRRDKLASLIDRFKKGAEQLGLPLLPSNSPIQPILLGDSRRAMIAGQRLLAAGFLLGTIRPPTVPAGSARLRVTFSALHEAEQIDRLLENLAKAVV